LNGSTFAQVDSTWVQKVCKINRIKPTDINIDGSINDIAWKNAVYNNDFLVKEPNEGEPPKEEVKFAVAYDDNYFYFSARMYRKEIDKIRNTSFRRDYTFNAEKIILVLDTYYDKRTSFSFALTASGSRSDYFSTNDSEYEREYNYNPVWEGKSQIDSLGWTCEMKIPFSQLRFEEKDSLVFGININQYTPTIKEDTYYVLIKRDNFGWASKFARLEGLEGIKPKVNFEFLPYLNARSLFVPNLEKSSPFYEYPENTLNTGLDLKLQASSNLTIDATFLPDFGQVEQDPSVVNLSAYEIYFQERRPFFVEGKQIFDRLGDLFYSRRIGASPRGFITKENTYSKSPTNTSILGAAKISGRINENISLAGLSSVTRRMFAEAVDTNGNQFSQEVEPLTAFNVLRLEREFDEANSYIGASLTSVERDINEGTSMFSRTANRAITGGLDMNYRLFDGNYNLYVGGNFSYISGTKEAMLRRQLSSLSFLQREFTSRKVDSNTTSLFGHYFNFDFEKYAGNFLFEVEYNEYSPTYDVNDMGFLPRVDSRNLDVMVGYQEFKATDYYYSYSAKLIKSYRYDFANIKLADEWGLNLRYVFNSRDGINLYYYSKNEVYDNENTRGGLLMKNPAGDYIGFYFNSDFSRRHKLNFSFDFERKLDLSRFRNYNISLVTQFLDNAEFSLGIGYSDNNDMRQYITTVGNSKNRYIFGELIQNTLYSNIRFNYVFSPDITLEIFSQPFISVGNYKQIGELATSKTNNIRNYGVAEGTSIVKGENNYIINDNGEEFSISNPNFNIVNLRSNIVFRWEVQPSTILFLVWQINGSNNFSDINFKSSNIFNSYRNDNTHLLAVKFQYWLPVSL